MSALVTIAGLPVVDLRLLLPRSGPWTADVSVDSRTELFGPVTLDLGGALKLSGTVRRGGVRSDVGVYRLVAGAGGLGKVATPKAYRQASANIVVRDLLGGVGEQLSPTADQSVLASTLGAWTTIQTATGVALASVLEHLGANVAWRVLADGTVWVGRESWPTAQADVFVQRINKRFDSMHVVFPPSGPVLLPGTTWQDRRVSYVELTVSADDGGNLEAEVWFE